MSREDIIIRAVRNMSQWGDCGKVLGKVIEDAITEENLHAGLLNKEPLDPRKVAILTMKNMRAAMEGLRDELDGIDSVGKYA